MRFQKSVENVILRPRLTNFHKSTTTLPTLARKRHLWLNTSIFKQFWHFANINRNGMAVRDNVIFSYILLFCYKSCIQSLRKLFHAYMHNRTNVFTFILGCLLKITKTLWLKWKKTSKSWPGTYSRLLFIKRLFISVRCVLSTGEQTSCSNFVQINKNYWRDHWKIAKDVLKFWWMLCCPTTVHWIEWSDLWSKFIPAWSFWSYLFEWQGKGMLILFVIERVECKNI